MYIWRHDICHVTASRWCHICQNVSPTPSNRYAEAIFAIGIIKKVTGENTRGVVSTPLGVRGLTRLHSIESSHYLAVTNVKVYKWQEMKCIFEHRKYDFLSRCTGTLVWQRHYRRLFTSWLKSHEVLEIPKTSGASGCITPCSLLRLIKPHNVIENNYFADWLWNNLKNM